MSPEPGPPLPASLLPLPARPALPERAGVEAGATPPPNGGDRPDDASAEGEPNRWLTAAEWLGRSFLALAVVTGLFVAHQLWATDWLQAREQRDLRDQFDEQLAAVGGPGGAGESIAEAAPAEPTPLGAPVPDQGLALIEIPALDRETVALDSVDPDDLRKGPGHYPSTVDPGEAGNAAFAGHRVTYGAPFHGIDLLEAGDEIVVTTLRGRFAYRVAEQRVVAPSDTRALEPTDDARLTLTTCHPELSARERLVVVASLDGEPLPPSDDPAGSAGSEVAAAPSLDGSADPGLGGLDAGFALWAALTFAVGGGWWWLFRRRPGVLTWVAGAVPFLAVLFFFFGQVEGLIPATF